MNRIILSIAALIAAAPLIYADDFDLTSQRSEIQEYNPVPGHRIERNADTEIAINPTPQQSSFDYSTSLVTAGGFKIKDKRGTLKNAVGFLPAPTGNGRPVSLTIDHGTKPAQRAGVKSTPGAYSLTINPEKMAIDIVGFDDAGAFYGLQTLRQIIENHPGILPTAQVRDWPALPYRGIVEGFYGTPWSHQVRLSLIDFYGRNKLNNYIYGPKDDPYHSSPNWRLPYPADQARQIAELVDACRRNRVNFVWAIHPGKDIRWDRADYDSLLTKLNLMYDLGVRAFAVFFDDIEGIGTDPARQAELVNSLTTDFVQKKKDVANIMICPTDYSQMWAKPGPEGPLAVYGRELNPKAEVFWTGAVVCSDLTPQTLDFINSRIKRPALFWWNFPVTDYCRHILLQGPVYGLDTNLTSAEVAGIESNPMEHGEASKTALFGVADWAWNTAAYNPIDNWERALIDIMPECPEAYRTFAIHSTDTETGYRRDESWETVTFPFDSYTPEQYSALADEFTRIIAAPDTIRARCANSGLVSEMDPWLTEFKKLGQRGLRTLSLIKAFETASDSAFWGQYVGNLMTPSDVAAYNAHKSGTMKLQPFYQNAMDGMLGSFWTKISGLPTSGYRGIGSYPNLRTNLDKLMLDSDTTTYWTSALAQSPGQWVGVDLGQVRPVDEILIRQGRNSVDDCDYFDHTILEASADGSTWIALTPELTNTYVISYSGDPIEARYVRLRRLDSARTNWTSIRTFQVNPPSPKRVGQPRIVCSDPDAALRAFDSDPATTYATSGTLTFDRQADADTITFLLSHISTPLFLTQFDADGHPRHTAAITSPFARIQLHPAASRITLAGSAEIHEIHQSK